MTHFRVPLATHPFLKGNRKRGFTLFELLVVIAVYAILAFLTIPALATWWGNFQFKGAQRTVASVLQQARAMAIAANEPRTVVITPPASLRIESPNVEILLAHSLSSYGDAGQLMDVATIPFTARGLLNLATPVTVGIRNAYSGTTVNITVHVTGKVQVP